MTLLSLIWSITCNAGDLLRVFVPALYVRPKKAILFLGECRGTISKKTLGEHGFGYDPIFIPDGETRTFAQMETEEKNRFSHRGKSLEKLKDYFKNL